MFVYICFNMYKKAPRYSFIEQDKCLEPVQNDKYVLTGGKVDPIVKNDAISENDYGLGYAVMNHSFKCKLFCEKI